MTADSCYAQSDAFAVQLDPEPFSMTYWWHSLFRFLTTMRWFSIPILLLYSCTQHTIGDPSNPIRSAMAEQEHAWDNGDIPAFMRHYSDTICFIGHGSRTCGREAVTANYLKTYPDKAAMGDLSFGIDEVLPTGNSHAWVTGTWKLYRTADTIGGGFSLLWVKEQAGWRIARDHTY